MKTTDGRQNWSKKLEFMLATIGYAVGLGNVWRFPYLCFKSGGGAFLLPFFIMMVVCGVPLAYMEMAAGQYTRQGPIGAIGKMCPFFKGAGLATVIISFLFTTYYIVIITWSFYYMFSSFQETLPWTSCNNTWNSDLCWENPVLKANATNVTMVMQPNGSRSPTEDYFIENVLEMSSGIDQQGHIRWQLLLILILSWVLVYFCIWKGTKSTGKVVYFTATFPYLVLGILFVRGVTLPGAMDGIEFFIKPRWDLLLDAKVWVYAAAQTFNSMGVAFGGLITMSSYNKFHNHIIRDVLTLAVVDAFTCILAGFAIFSILGNLALVQGKGVETVVQEGPGLVFVIYPQAFNTMPVAQLFSVLFFFMLVCLGIDSQFASVEVVVTMLQDHFGHLIQRYFRRKEVLVLVVCFVSFLCGLPNITQGGFYFFQLIDYYGAALSLLMLTVFEVIAICWFYGARNLAENIRQMTGSKPGIFFLICWYVVSPLLLVAIWIFSLIQHKPLSVAGYSYPDWAMGIGWGIALISVVCIPLGMVQAVITTKGNSLFQKFTKSFQTTLQNESATPTSSGDDSCDEAMLTKVITSAGNSDNLLDKSMITTNFVDQSDCQPQSKHCIQL